MKIRQTQIGNSTKTSTHAFTLVETMVAIIALGTIMVPALYACFSIGFATMRVSREDLRATEMLVQRMETLRLCPFDDVRTNTVRIPTSVNETYNGTTYTITFNNAVPASGTLPDSYRTNMLIVTATASWTNKNVQRTRTVQTYVARNGMQGYVIDGK